MQKIQILIFFESVLYLKSVSMPLILDREAWYTGNSEQESTGSSKNVVSIWSRPIVYHESSVTKSLSILWFALEILAFQTQFWIDLLVRVESFLVCSEQAQCKCMLLFCWNFAAEKSNRHHFRRKIPQVAFKCRQGTLWNYLVNSSVLQYLLIQKQIWCINSRTSWQPPRAVYWSGKDNKVSQLWQLLSWSSGGGL